MSDDDRVEGYDEIEATSDEDKVIRDPSSVSSEDSSSASTMRGHDSEDEVGNKFADSPTVVVGSRVLPLTAI